MVPALLLAVAISGFGQTVDLTILSTTDIHNNYLDYDYFTDTPTEQTGLVRIATAIAQEREKSRNVLLFDDGDNIQGNPLGEYLAKNPPLEGEISPIMTLLNAMDYDAMALGNHEFNFGLSYLNTVVRGAEFPVVCANAVNYITKTPYFNPYTILVRAFEDTDGGLQTVRIGVLGLLPPQITSWDGIHLRGRMRTLDGYETAQKYVPEMKAAGADIVVILAHSGIVDYPWKGGEENFSYFLTQIPDVDVVISGHSHAKFPGSAYAKTAGADIAGGTINGIPVVMAGSFGDTLGLINLRVEKQGDSWKRVSGGSRLVSVYDAVNRKANFAPDAELSALLSGVHDAVLNYIRSPVGADELGEVAGGSLSEPLTSFFSLVRDDYSVQIINESQMWYARQALEGTPYTELPLLSAAAPFKAGGRQGPRYYTNVPAGPLAIKNIADLYVYPNTVMILKLTGAGIKEWLEMSAGQFNQIDPAGQEEQFLVNEAFPTYLFDVIDGVTYQIDVTQPARYNPDGSLRDAGAERIKNLCFEGEPIDGAREFALVTNNFRAYGGGNFPGGNPSNIILETPEESRQVILRYIDYRRRIDPEPDNNWSLILPQGTGPLLYVSSPLAQEFDVPGIDFVRTAETGFGIYAITP
jgi:2',3'-cyclic-nucleotide 2'-phosphodiesterase/3'-nucleotidase